MNSPGFRQFLYTVLGVGGCAVILGGSYFLGYRPLQREEAETLQRREKISRMGATRDVVRRRNRDLSASETKLAETVAALSRRVAQVSRDHEFLRELSRMAKGTQTQLVDFQPAGFGQFNGLQTAIVRISIRGDYRGIGSFLALLENSNRLQRFTQWQMNLSDREHGMFDVRVEVQEFLKPKSQAPASARRT